MVLTRKRRAELAFQEKLYNADIWECIASFLDAPDLARLALTARFFVPIAMDERLWKALSLKRLEIGIGSEASKFRPHFSWRELYRSSFVTGSHSYSIHEREKHLDWMRIGAFTLVSGKALAAGRLWQRISKSKRIKLDESSALCLVPNVLPGIWIADLHMTRCPVCNLPACPGTMQTLDFRNWELFLHEEYQNRTWSFKEIGIRNIRENCDVAAGAVFDYKRLIDKDTANSGILNFKSWTAENGNYQPASRVSPFGAAGCTNLQKNGGLQVKFYAMHAGVGGPVVAIRVSQQLF
ncbi:probable F-box protein At3g61730 [Selaginella moellendorffii]|uniref:probable F-box protein At3g61730 n=1 Tax=Selaginella moellendorffii TaxID=88036 RepID=UPI000D1C377D|nr:probable F-box protein At3g61730 [Selaginella moellendorffii]|eukprot:XP_024540695.1 probable F-box protein At3g61730 [Selaginella moellendorffii]